MSASEERALLLATHSSIRARRDEEPEEEESPAGETPENLDAATTQTVNRLAILRYLFETPERTKVVAAQLERNRSAAAQTMVRLAQLAIDSDWKKLGVAVSDLTPTQFRHAVDAWLDAERAVATDIATGFTKSVADLAAARAALAATGGVGLPFPDHRGGRGGVTVPPPTGTRGRAGAAAGAVTAAGVLESFRDVTLTERTIRSEGRGADAGRLIRASASGAGTFDTGVAKAVIAGIALAPPPISTVLEGLPANKAAIAKSFLFGALDPVERDTAQLIAYVDQKKTTVAAMIQLAEVEPVGYLHLEKLFFEPMGAVEGQMVQCIPFLPGETRRFMHREWASTSSEYSKLISESLEKSAEESLAETSEITESTKSENSRSLALSLAANVSGSYGTVSFSVSSGLNVNQSESQSREVSATRSREVTAKASSRSKEERKIEFKFTSEQGTSDETFQEVTHPGTEPASYAYYRLMLKWKVSLARYGVRLTYDLVLPDPANRLLRSYQRMWELRANLLRNDTFTLTPTSITRAIYPSIAAQYGAALEPPPPEQIYAVASATHSQPEKEKFESFSLALTIPEGYAFTGSYQIDYDRGYYGNPDEVALYAETNENASKLAGVRNTFGWVYYVQWGDAKGAAVAIQIRVGAQMTVERLRQWQMESWSRCHDAWMTRRDQQRSEWRRELDELEEKLGKDDALTLRKREHEEIMRACLAWLIGPAFDFYPDVLPTPPAAAGADTGLYNGEGQVISEQVHSDFLRHGQLIGFLHRAIEWENLIYVIYPYFWTHESRWDTKDDIRHPDFVHQTFLRGGAARAVLTIRPGFELDFLAYVKNAALDVPLPNTHPYVTVAEELKALAQTSYPYTPAANPPDPANIVDTWYEFTPTGGMYVKELTLP
jgi:hypothetical protein